MCARKVWDDHCKAYHRHEAIMNSNAQLEVIFKSVYNLDLFLTILGKIKLLVDMMELEEQFLLQ